VKTVDSLIDKIGMVKEPDSGGLLGGQYRFPYCEEVAGVFNIASKKSSSSSMKSSSTSTSSGTSGTTTKFSPSATRIGHVKHQFSSQTHEYEVYLILDPGDTETISRLQIKWFNLNDFHRNLVSSGQKKLWETAKKWIEKDGSKKETACSAVPKLDAFGLVKKKSK